MSYERRKVRVGQVVSDKMDKTVVVVYEWRQSHSIYKKSVRRQAKFYAHDEENRCSLGDTVRIIESRPYSKTKRWKVAEILSSIEIADVQPEQIQMDEDILSASATSAALAQSEAAETDTTASVDEDILSASATSAALVQSEAAETDTTASVDEDILSASATSAALAQSEAAETDTTASVDEDILSASATSAALAQSCAERGG
jgi:small subunit ribosomal protein S17